MVSDLGLHFYFETVVLFTTLTVMLALLVKDDVMRWATQAPPAAPPAEPPPSPS
jgi:hypothetical protein